MAAALALPATRLRWVLSPVASALALSAAWAVPLLSRRGDVRGWPRHAEHDRLARAHRVALERAQRGAEVARLPRARGAELPDADQRATRDDTVHDRGVDRRHRGQRRGCDHLEAARARQRDRVHGRRRLARRRCCRWLRRWCCRWLRRWAR